MKIPDVEAIFDRVVLWLRRKSKKFDHFWLALMRFFEVDAGRLSAAISYYAFFAAFSLTLLALAVFGYLLKIEKLYNVVDEWLTENLPIIGVETIAESAQTVGLIALGALVITGVSWVQAIRTSIRAVWLLEQEPGNPILRWIIDLAVLIALGILLVGTLAITAIAEVALEWLRNGNDNHTLSQVISYGGTIVGVVVNTVLTAALLSALPRLALPFKRIVFPALWVAIGLEGLKTLGSIYIKSAAGRPAYQAVGTAVGLLIFLYLFNNMLMFASAWTATSARGKAIDMADRERPRIDTDELSRVHRSA